MVLLLICLLIILTVLHLNLKQKQQAEQKMMVQKMLNVKIKIVKIRVPLKYLSNVWRILEMSLINCKINLILTWSNRCFIIDNPIASQEPIFTITDKKLYVPVVTLLTLSGCKTAWTI